LFTAVITFGEGWHNYHHTFPWDYRSGEFGMDIVNLPTSFIDFFAKLGWAYDLKSASPELIMKTAEKKGDGSRFVGGKAIVEAKAE
jgi:stearoyl-CoA desaturase (Delta-9 desaturase)